MPRCTVCKTTESLELYKGQFRCADHIGTLEEIELKRALIFENLGPLGEIALSSHPELSATNDQVVRDQITADWIKKQKTRQQKKLEAPLFTIVEGKEIGRQDIALRYGNPGAKK